MAEEKVRTLRFKCPKCRKTYVMKIKQSSIYTRDGECCTDMECPECLTKARYVIPLEDVWK